MAARFLLSVVVVSAMVAPPIFAESTYCTTPVLIVSDGRVTQSTFPQNTTYWYGIYVAQTQVGHSYSVEFVPQADNYLNSIHVQFDTLAVYGPSDSLQACRGNSSVSTTQNSGYSPVLRNGNGTGRRVSFTALSAGLYLISGTNLAASGAYSFRAVDTTLFNPRWSTWSGYDDQWGFMNLSDMPITGTLTVYGPNNGAIVAVQVTVPAGGEVFRSSNSSDLNLPRNSSGYAIFSHNGPPNSILADAYMLNSSATVVVPSKFETRATQ